MNAARSSKTALVLVSIVASLCLVLALPGPALAQTSPASGQYVGEGADTFAESAEQGTDAVNDAMAETASSSASPAASGEVSGEASVSPAGATSSNDADGDAQAGSGGAADANTDEGLGSIKELPDTGGTPLAALISGVLLVALGLMVRVVLQPWTNRDA